MEIEAMKYPDEIGRIMPPDEQLRRWVKGDSVHNGATKSNGECCPDFSCCQPNALAPKIAREKFAAANESDRIWMAVHFLGCAVADENVYIAGQGTEQ